MDFLCSIKRAGGKIKLALNMHSQSAPKASYWVHSAASSSAKSHRNQLLFSALSMQENPNFSWKDLDYSKQQKKFIEGWFFDVFSHDCTALTFETPYSFYGNNRNGEWVNTQNLARFARNSLAAIINMLEIDSAREIGTNEPNRAKGFQRRHRNTHRIHFGESYLRAKKANAELSYKCHLPKGRYLVYRWQPEAFGRSAGANAWQLHAEHTQTKDGETKYKIKASRKGEAFDRIRFINIVK